MIKAILLKPLNGQEVGSPVELSQQDFDYLEGLRAVRAAEPVEEAPVEEEPVEAVPDEGDDAEPSGEEADAKPARKPRGQAKS